ncbi:hypothetical protein CYMTET_20002 [Cymbomonas tetramitiformis]|uniref:Polycystin cation channel PKD1/PKD2 domain-containing protein n=1 Tax=Cymbomonas tetramitiformis TaxID=36881 RepID=A0AAE0G4Y5_9CHLO|nr:hypothetical protein CYMTET_20002 [Cymbomonas tetramitiformis]
MTRHGVLCQVDYTNWLVAAAAGYGFSVGVRIISVEAVGGELTVTSMVFFPVDQRSAASTFSDALLTSGTSGIPSTWSISANCTASSLEVVYAIAHGEFVCPFACTDSNVTGNTSRAPCPCTAAVCGCTDCASLFFAEVPPLCHDGIEAYCADPAWPADPGCATFDNRTHVSSHFSASVGGTITDGTPTLNGCPVVLTVPAGVLDSPGATLSISALRDEEMTASPEPALYGSRLSHLLALKPHGINFAAPVTVEIPYWTNASSGAVHLLRTSSSLNASLSNVNFTTRTPTPESLAIPPPCPPSPPSPPPTPSPPPPFAPLPSVPSICPPAPPLPPQPPLPPLGATIAYTVVSEVAFSDLDMNQFEDGAFSEAFHSQFEAQIAAAAGVDTEAVIVTGIVAASIVITSEVIFPSGLEVAAVAHFEKALMDDPGGIFTDPDFMAYGEVSTEQVSLTQNLVLVSDLGADTGSATWAVADVTPPEITVFGGTSLTVPQVPDAYVELGATGFDQQDGCLVVEIEGASELDTLVATGDGPAHKVVYSAVDAAGNSRTVTRLVTVASSCKPPSFPCPQLEGVVCATCLPDVPCLCLSPITIGSDNTVDSDGTVAARAPGGFVPHVDTRDPSLSMRGDGQLGQTPDGTTVMYDYLEVGWPYEDGGATAWDATEGNVTAHVSRFGVAAISSSTVTPEDQPWVVTYGAADSAGNLAKEVERRVVVVDSCPGERLCGDAVTCSVAGLCRQEPPQPSARAQPPLLTLVGPAEVGLPEGSTVEAADPVEGDLGELVLACGKSWRKYGVSACGVVAGSPPGSYSIHFTVTNSAGMQAAATRVVIVQPQCDAREALCYNQRTCSVQGICVSDLDYGLARFLTFAGDADEGTEGTGEEDVAGVSATAPTMSLRSLGQVQGGHVSVPQGGAYELCTALQLAEADEAVLCEPGVDATDAAGLDLSDMVVVCPPAECFARGCPGHELRRKGLSHCVNTSSQVGTVYEVVFFVLDSSMPALNATAVRTVTITSPCSDGERLCGATCSAVPCNVLAELEGNEADLEPPPEISLRGPEVIRVLYGDTEEAARLRPCAVGEQLGDASCYAAAWDAMDGDISSRIRMELGAKCEGCADVVCGAATLLAGGCLPGQHKYLYRVTNRAGFDDAVQITVYVAEAGTVTSVVNLAAEGSSAQAEQTMALFDDPASSESRAFRRGVANLLSDSLASAIQPEDVTIGVTWLVNMSTGASGGGRVAVNFTVAIHTEPDESQTPRRRRLASKHEEDKLEGLMDRASNTLRMEAVPGGALETSLVAAATAEGATKLPTAVEGFLEESWTQGRVTARVDEEGFTRGLGFALVEETRALVRKQESMEAEMEALEAEVAGSGGEPQAWRLGLLETWVKGLEEEVEHVESLTDSVLLAQSLAEVQVGQVGAVAAALTAAQTDVEGETRALTEHLRATLLSPGSDGEGEVCIRPGASAAAFEERFEFVVPGEASTTEDLGAIRRRRLQRATPGGKVYPRRFEDWGEVVSEALPTKKSHLRENDYQEYADWSLDAVAGRAPFGVSEKVGGELKHYVARDNRLLGGLVMGIQRAEDAECTGKYRQLAPRTCPVGEHLYDWYGRDPVFNGVSELFRPDLQDDITRFYNTSQGSEEVFHKGSLRLPHAFTPRPMRSQESAYVMALDSRLGAFRAQQLYTLLADGDALDEHATKVTAQALTYNSHLNMLTNAYIIWRRNAAGSWEDTFYTYSVPVVNWGSSVFTSLLPGVFLLWMLISARMAYVEVIRLADACAEGDLTTSRYETLFQLRLHNFCTHMMHIKNILRIIAASTQLIAVVMYFHQLYLLHVLDLDAGFRIYDDLYAAARFLLPAKKAPGASLGLSEAELGTRWGLEDDPSGWDEMDSMLLTANVIAAANRIYWNMQVLIIVLMQIAILVHMHFHLGLGMVARTLGFSANEILHWMASFVVIAGFYVPLGAIFYPYSHWFAGGNSVRYVLELAIVGEYHSVRKSQRAMYESDSEKLLKELIFIPSIFWLVYIILNNAMLAIMANGLAAFKHSTQDTSSNNAIQEILQELQYQISRRARNWPSMHSFRKALHVWTRLLEMRALMQGPHVRRGRALGQISRNRRDPGNSSRMQTRVRRGSVATELVDEVMQDMLLENEGSSEAPRHRVSLNRACLKGLNKVQKESRSVYLDSRPMGSIELRRLLLLRFEAHKVADLEQSANHATDIAIHAVEHDELLEMECRARTRQKLLASGKIQSPIFHTALIHLPKGFFLHTAEEVKAKRRAKKLLRQMQSRQKVKACLDHLELGHRKIQRHQEVFEENVASAMLWRDHDHLDIPGISFGGT